MLRNFKKGFAITFIIISLIFTSCSSNNKKVENESIPDFHFEEVKPFTEITNKYKNPNYLPGIISILTDKVSPKRIYVLTGFGLFKSDNGGLSWNLLPLPVNDATGASIDSDGDIYLTCYDGVWASYDRGMHWKEILFESELGNFEEYEPITISQNRLYVNAGWKVFESEDKGAHFKEISINIDLFRMTGYSINKVRADPNNPNVIFTITNRGLLLSTNDGESFNLLNVRTKSMEYGDVSDIAVFKGVVLAIAYRANPPFNAFHDLLLSKDYGKTWKVVQEDVPFLSLIEDPYNDTNLFALGYGLFQIYDYGSSYQYLGVSNPSAVAFDWNNRNHIYAGTSCGKLFESKPGKGNLIIIDRDAYPVTSIDVSNGSVYVAKKGVYKSEDQLHFEKLTNVGDFIATGNAAHNSILIGSMDGGIFTYDEASLKLTKLSNEKVFSIAEDSKKLNAYIGTEHGVYRYSFEKGILEHIAFEDEFPVVAVDSANPDVIYAASGIFKNGHAIYRSKDTGKSWSLCDDNILDIKDKNDLLNLSGLDWPIAIFANGKDIYVSIFPQFPGQQGMYIGYGRLKGGLFVSKDYGKTWQYIDTLLENKNDPYIYVDNILEYKGKLFVAVGKEYGDACNKLKYSEDLKTWKNLLGDLPSQYISSTYIDRDKGVLYIGTSGGIYKMDIGNALSNGVESKM
jgi:hypothetical protein